MAEVAAALKKTKQAAQEAAETTELTALLLTTLAEQGPKSIAELLGAVNGAATLGEVLHALKDVRDFRLIELIGEDDLVQLTPAGRRTSDVVLKGHIRHEATKLLA